MRNTTTYMGAILAAALGAAVAAWAPARDARARALDTISHPGGVDLSYRVIPTVADPPTADERLELRLAALARSIELRPRLDAALLAFDVTGLGQRLEGIVADLEGRAQVSVHVRDLESQHVLFDFYGDAPLNPASNQKLLTASAALDILGPEYTFDTAVLREGNTLVLRGEGDPTLKTEDLDALAAETARQVQLGGIERLVVDATAFSSDRFAPGLAAGGDGYAYTAPSGAVSVDFNTVAISVYRAGKRARVAVSPETPDVVVRNRARVGRRHSLSVRSFEERGRTIIEVTGQLGTDAVHLRRRIHDPALHAGQVFAARLAEHWASRPLPVEPGRLGSRAEELVLHRSAPLIEVVDAGLAYSNNFMAEQILRTVAWRMTGDPGDWDTGALVLEGYWSALGNDPASIVVENASGLSATGRVTTSGLVDLISVAHRNPDVGSGLIDALPVAGEPGTLRTRLRHSGKRVRAKTGTLDGVSGLTGVIAREDGAPQVAFSILINAREPGDVNARKRRSVEDRLVLEVLRELDAHELRRAGPA